MRTSQKQIDPLKSDAIAFGRCSEREHRIEINKRLGARPFANQSRPHRIVQFWIVIHEMKSSVGGDCWALIGGVMCKRRLQPLPSGAPRRASDFRPNQYR